MLVQDDEVICLSAAMILAFCRMFCIPISWSKLQLKSSVLWIGWHFGFASGTFCIPEEKVTRLKQLLLQALSGRHTSKNTLEKVVGLLQWFCKLHKTFKPWLCTLYGDMHRPMATNCSIDPGSWKGLSAFLDDSLTFVSRPPGLAVSPGTKLIEARHVPLKSKEDLGKVATSKRIWMRVADPSTQRRKLCKASRDSLLFWQDWCARPQLPMPLQKPPLVDFVTAAADARGDGDIVGIGGFLDFGKGQVVGFSQTWRLCDLACLGLPLQMPAHRDITCYETLAQMGLILCLRSVVPCARWQLRLRTFSDNSGTEAGVNKLYSSSFPLSAFLQRLCMLACSTGIALDVSHIPGEKNDEADMLSRWTDESVPLPPKFDLANRVDCSLERLWHFRTDIRLWPPCASLKWRHP